MKKIEGVDLEIYTIDSFLNDDECNRLIEMIDSSAVRSSVASGDNQFSVISDYRTSSTGILPVDDLFIRKIDRRIHDSLNVPLHLGESIQGQRYDVGQEFKDHTDYFEGSDIKLHCADMGNRTWTFMIYLNDDLEGGETEFSRLGIVFKPKKGTAIVWNSRTQEMGFNYNSLHAGRPVLQGKKYIITKWMRDGIKYTEPNTKVFSNHQELPRLTEKGFTINKVPDATWALIKEAYELLKPFKVEEYKDSVLDNKLGVNPTEILSFDRLPTIRGIIHDNLLSAHEEWCGEKLEKTYVYGIRSYKKGSTLAIHKDRVETHHISAIIIVDKNPIEPNWALDIQDHDGVWHKVYAEVGDMILYESAICDHARLDENPNEYFRNFYVHYKLKGWEYKA